MAAKTPPRDYPERPLIKMLQGTAADLIKLAMVNVDRRLREEKYQAAKLLQVHDELVFEAGEMRSERDAAGAVVNLRYADFTQRACPSVVGRPSVPKCPAAACEIRADRDDASNSGNERKKRTLFEALSHCLEFTGLNANEPGDEGRALLVEGPQRPSLLRGPRDRSLAEHAGELFIGKWACGSDAGFEEALAAK